MLTSYLWVKTLSTEFKFNNYIETEKTHEKTIGQVGTGVRKMAEATT